MLAAMLVAATLLSLSLGHWTGGGGGGSTATGTGGWGSRQNGGYCRGRYGYLYRCDDTSWGSGNRWNSYYGSGGYYERARYVGRGRVRQRARGDGTELVCDFRRDGRLNYGERVQSVVWKKVRDNYGSGGYYGSSNGGYYGSSNGGYYGSGNGGFYGSGSGSYGSGSGSYDSGGGRYGGSFSGGCGGSITTGIGCSGSFYPGGNRHYPSYPGSAGGGAVAGWVTTYGDVSTLTLIDPRPYDFGQYRCIAQVSGRSSYGRGRDLVYMEVDYRGYGSGGSWGGSGGSWGGSGSSGWGGSGWGGSGWGWNSYGRSALTKTQPDRVVDGDGAAAAKSADSALQPERQD